MRFAIWLILVVWLAMVVAVRAADYSSDDPPTTAKPIQGRLLSREVYDLAGKKVGLEEYSDAGTVEVKAKPKAKPVRATMPTEYKQFGAYWYKSIDGGDWTYCKECNPSQGAAGPAVQSPMLTAPVYYPAYTPAYTMPVYQTQRFSAGLAVGGFQTGASIGACVGGG